ncbi:MAG: signal peptidase II, partial [Opitutaceae bacterium]
MNPIDPAKPAGATTTLVEGNRPATRRPLWVRIRAYRTLWIIALTVFALDQATKLWIVSHVPFDPM